jgi:hypothetical protein
MRAAAHFDIPAGEEVEPEWYIALVLRQAEVGCRKTRKIYFQNEPVVRN